MLVRIDKEIRGLGIFAVEYNDTDVILLTLEVGSAGTCELDAKSHRNPNRRSQKRNQLSDG